MTKLTREKAIQAWQIRVIPVTAVLVIAAVLFPMRQGIAAQKTDRGRAEFRPGASQKTESIPAEYTYVVVHTYPHDPNAFTQGLAYRDGFLYEGTGRNGQSSLRKVRLETGEVLQKTELGREFFGEGIALFKNEIVELTWTSQTGFVYDAADFHLLRRFSYPGEGWGLATHEDEIFMSDGSPEIRVLDAVSLKEKRRIKVHEGSKPLHEINELEWVEGEIFANVWLSNRIARISPQTGTVVGWIDLSGILNFTNQPDPNAVLNGIAYDPEHKRLFVTGKLWPSLFEIKVVPKPAK